MAASNGRSRCVELVLFTRIGDEVEHRGREVAAEDQLPSPARDHTPVVLEVAERDCRPAGGCAAHQPHKRLPFIPRHRRNPHELGDRGRDIQGADCIGDPHARWQPIREAKHQRHVQKLLINLVAVSPGSVVVELFPMIRRHHQQGILPQAKRDQSIDEEPEEVIVLRDLAIM